VARVNHDTAEINKCYVDLSEVNAEKEQVCVSGKTVLKLH